MAMIRSLPTRPRKYSFSFTPLADAMFQLLVFFMLTSSLAPYSLMTLKPGATGTIPLAGEAREAPETTDPQDIAVWSLISGAIRVEGERIPLDELPEILGSVNLDRVVLITGRSATVQDVATALESLSVAGVPTVQLVGSP